MKETGGGTRCKQSTWARWESGLARPDFPNAVAIEVITDGAVKVEAWGYEAAASFELVRRREAAARAERRRAAKAAADPQAPAPTEPAAAE